MNLKIALSGPAGTGKSTVLTDMRESAYLNVYVPTQLGDFTYIEEPVRTLKAKTGMEINDLGNLETELLVMTTHIQNVLLYPMLITDRCIVDNIVYSKLSKDFEDKEEYLKCAEFLKDKTLDNFDLIFYIKPEFEPPEDGVRSINNDFYKKSVEGFENVYTELMKDHDNIHILKGSRKERIDFIENKIYEVMKMKLKEEVEV